MGLKNFASYIYDYRLADKNMEIVLFGTIPIIKVPYDEIKSVREVSLKETLIPDFSTLRFGNRFTSSIVEIQKKGAIVKRILITPEDSKKFIETVNKKIEK